MVTEVADVEYIVTDTVSEAYLLESNLIKEHRPRFNIRLRDDKSYPFVKITLGEDFPRIVRTRRLVRDGSRYFGPYASASSVDETLKLLRKIFPFRTCNLDIPEGKRVLERPCLLYFINRCQGPCIQAIEKAAVPATRSARSSTSWTASRSRSRRSCAARCSGHSDALRYEQAAVARDKLRAVERTMEQQKMAAFSRAEHDVIGMAREEDEACVQVMQVRNGKLIGREHFIVEGARDVTDAEVLGSFLQQYYASTDAVPRALLAPLMPADADDLAAYLADRRGVQRHDQRAGARGEAAAGGARHPERGRGAGARARRMDGRRREARRGAHRSSPPRSGCARVPERIECYDMSNIQGTRAVGSAWSSSSTARPEPREYRRFRIRSGDTPDDFRMMAEVLRRRFSRVARLRAETGRAVAGGGRRRRGAGGGARRRRAARPRPGRRTGPGPIERAPRETGWAVPDLVIVDGGKGQLSAAVGAMDELGITDVPLTGLAKRFEELYLPGRAAPVVLPRRSQALYLVQRIRDEAHRFAITYHRDVRGKRALRSELDEIEGIGPGRKKALLKRFGSVRRIREASVEEVAATPGISRDLAERLKAHLAREGMLA